MKKQFQLNKEGTGKFIFLRPFYFAFNYLKQIKSEIKKKQQWYVNVH